MDNVKKDFFMMRLVTNEPNYVVFEHNRTQYMFSYKTLIASREAGGDVFLDEKSWNCSATTNKHRCRFLGESGAETEKKIKSGKYKLVNLNN